MKIVKALKHTFIPHDENDYKPHFFREISVAFFLFVSVFLLGASEGTSFFIHKTVLGASIAASVLVDLTNDHRLASNELPLTRNTQLDQVALLKGEDMASVGYFAHNSPTGVTPWFWFGKVGYNFLYAGENLAIDFTKSEDVENAWLNSPTHKANLLNVNFREIGIAAVEGIYENKPTIFIVQTFGTPALAEAKESTTPVAKKIEQLPQQKEVVATSPPELKKVVIASLTASTTQEEVQGKSIEISQPFKPLITNEKLAVVQNVQAQESLPITETPQVQKYSKWYERIIFVGPQYVDIIYKILIILVAFAFVTMILVEFRKQHYKHILYGVFLLTVLIIFAYINSWLF